MYYFVETSSKFVVAYLIAECNDTEGTVSVLEVHPDYRRKGLCVRMLNEYINRFPCGNYKLTNTGGTAAQKCYDNVFRVNGYDVKWTDDKMIASKIHS